MTEHSDLSPAAATLSRAAPREWEAFKTAFRKFADGTRTSLVKAGLDELQKSQGRAQQCDHLVSLFDDAEKATDRISARPVK